ncbi:hypothetical protein BHE74_00026723 [Ensete ventricosum]|nr:hypothetical protein GW17_00037594 [Ensete ventricosum]RWW65936.1 hypothetical protein BHE74_00026723 [Ensete ventricosum]
MERLATSENHRSSHSGTCFDAENPVAFDRRPTSAVTAKWNPSWSTLRTEGEGVIVGGQEVLVGHDDSHGADDVHGPRTRVRHRRQTLPVLHSSRLLDRTGVVDLPKARGRVGSGGSRRGEGRRVAQGERMRRGEGQ